MATKFTLFKGTNEQYYFNLKAGNGEKILQSEGYTTKSACENGIESVKQHGPYDSSYEKRISINNEYYFVLKAVNNRIVGTSEMYSSSWNRDQGIEVVKREAPAAVTEDKT